MPYYEKIEWELLQNKIVLENFEWNFEFPFEMPHIKEIKICRDEFYKLYIEIKCLINKKPINKIKEVEIIDFIKIKSKFSSDEYLITHSTFLKSVTSYENSNVILKISLFPTKIIFNPHNTENIAWIKEWHLNGPTSNIFSRTTTYTKKEIYEKELNKTPTELSNIDKFKIETNEKKSTSLNYLFCKLNDGENVIIGKVPDKMNPNWSNSISISYNSEKFINDNQLRKNIENIISLIFGRKLIKIAESYYDYNGNKVKEIIFNPFLNQKFNIKNICKVGDNFIIPIQYHSRDIELIISNLINSFIEKSDKIDFSSMLVNYWNSLFLPPESKIILLAASLESIKNKWFKSQNLKSKEVIINKSLYKILIKDFKEIFLLIFSECPLLVNNFNHINKRSIRKGFEIFFEEIGIEMGDIEFDALKARNNPAHGNDIDTETFSNLIIYTDVYQIIINRVILTLLDYDGLYLIHNSVQPISIHDKIPYSLEKLRDEIYEIKNYEIE